MAPRITSREKRCSDTACTVVTEGVMVLNSSSKSGIAAGLHVWEQRRQVVVVHYLICGALRPDAKRLRCGQFTLPML
jgi:hypothetical protein